MAQAIAEFGRIEKTLHTLMYIDDEAMRRSILSQLNRGEGRHSVARAVFHGKRGELRQHYREGQEDQLNTYQFYKIIENRGKGSSFCKHRFK